MLMADGLVFAWWFGLVLDLDLIVLFLIRVIADFTAGFFFL